MYLTVRHHEEYKKTNEQENTSFKTITYFSVLHVLFCLAKYKADNKRLE